MFEKLGNAFLKRGAVGHAKKVLSIVERLEARSSTKKQKDWIQKHTQLYYNISRLVDREIYISEEMRALEKRQEIEQQDMAQKQIDDYQKELQEINTSIWFGIRDLHFSKFKEPEGSYLQNIYLVTEHEHKALELFEIKICKSNGGCCAYSCGCCSKPRNSVREGDWKFHCTDACGCCVRRRGTLLSVEPPRINVVKFDSKQYSNK
jgi:hypothetical protein